MIPSWLAMLIGLAIFVVLEVLKRVPVVGTWMNDAKWKDLAALGILGLTTFAGALLAGAAPLDALQVAGQAALSAMGIWSGKQALS